MELANIPITIVLAQFKNYIYNVNPNPSTITT